MLERQNKISSKRLRFVHLFGFYSFHELCSEILEDVFLIEVVFLNNENSKT